MPDMESNSVARRVVAHARQVIKNNRAMFLLKRAIYGLFDSNQGIVIVDPLHDFSCFAPQTGGKYSARAHAAITGVQKLLPLLSSVADKCDGYFVEKCTASEFCKSLQGEAQAKKISELFSFYGSDKSTTHDYHLIYGGIFADLSLVRAICEIGLGTHNIDTLSNMGRDGRPGASLRAFRDYFPSCMVYGADIDTRILFHEDRISTCYVDQTDISSFGRLSDILVGDIDLIIDDGLHAPHSNLTSLLFAIDKVSVGGWIVIEDIAKDAEPLWNAVAAIMRPKMACKIIRCRRAIVFLAKKMR